MEKPDEINRQREWLEYIEVSGATILSAELRIASTILNIDPGQRKVGKNFLWYISEDGNIIVVGFVYTGEEAQAAIDGAWEMMKSGKAPGR